MGAFIVRRLLQMIPTLFGVMLLIFFLFNFVAGDPALLLAGKFPNPEKIQEIRHNLGLDQSVIQQLWIFAKQVFTFDFGRSWSTNEEVSKLIASRIGPTLTIMIPVLILETGLAVMLAMGVSYVRGTLTDRSVMVLCTVAMSISLLVYIIVGQYYFAFQKGWFPVQGWTDNTWKNIVTYAPLPVLLTVTVGLAPAIRLYRTFFLDEINADYVRTARAKGLSEGVVMFKHVLRNAMIPVLTYLSVMIPAMLVGLFLLEKFFSIPGLGREVLIAVERSDFPVVKAIVMYLAMFTMLLNLLVDVLYKFVDPRVQLK